MAIIIKDKNGNPTHVAGLGKQGPTGKSAYQYAVEAGFTGTESEFAARMDMYSNENLLDNWYFIDPINQKGKTEYTGAGYMIDRWYMTQGILTISDDGIILNNSADAVNEQWLDQRLEIDYRHTSTMTLSVYISEISGKIALCLSDGGIFIEVTTPGVYQITGIMSGSGSAVKLIVHPSSVVKIKAIKLELGPVQTLAHKDASGNWVLNDPPPNKALELEKCKRYYCKKAFANGVVTYSVNGLVVIMPEAGADFEMRVHPTVSICGANAGRTPNRVSMYSDFEVLASGNINLVKTSQQGIYSLELSDSDLSLGTRVAFTYTADANL